MQAINKNRHSVRLKGYNYAQKGYYFITICTQNRQPLFGKISNGKIHLNNAGTLIEKWWAQLPKKFPTIKIHTHITMPDHIHAIIQITEIPAEASAEASAVRADPCVCPSLPTEKTNIEKTNANIGSFGSGSSVQTRGEHMGSPLHAVVQWFKTMSTNDFIRGVKFGGLAPFEKRVWQRNYWERVIRDERELDNVRAYIRNNPGKWRGD